MTSDETFQDRDPWKILADTVHSLVMYKHHKRFVKDQVLIREPDITPEDLAGKMGIPLGEALVLLSELKTERKNTEGGKPTSR